MKCPTCGVEMDEVTEGEILVDRCPSCGGLWFDPDELRSYYSQRGVEGCFDGWQFQEFERLELPFVEFCPRCPNEKLSFGTSRNFSMSLCERCKGIFVDKSQIAALEKSVVQCVLEEVAPGFLGGILDSILDKLVPR